MKKKNRIPALLLSGILLFSEASGITVWAEPDTDAAVQEEDGTPEGGTREEDGTPEGRTRKEDGAPEDGTQEEDGTPEGETQEALTTADYEAQALQLSLIHI